MTAFRGYCFPDLAAKLQDLKGSLKEGVNGKAESLMFLGVPWKL